MMSDESRIRQLVEDVLASDRTPEEVCTDTPELLLEVCQRLDQIRRLGLAFDELFPLHGPTSFEQIDHLWRIGKSLPSINGHDVEGVLGHGGMGVVFRARHRALNRPVAVKMLLSGAYAGPQELGRFHREAEAVAALRHPNIVQVYEVGDVEGRPFFTMELVEGGSLAGQLAETPQPVRRAAELVETLAAAVHFAHCSCIIHRDLKPANILLTADGTPKITDFGLARRLGGGGSVTLSGAVVGTPCYMAPEQALGKSHEIGPAVDIYALGAILYELLTGRPPFDGNSAAETELQVITDEPEPPSRFNAKVPRDLATICLKCLQKNPSRRYASAQDLADDLHRYLSGHPVVARPVGIAEQAMKWAKRRPALATLVLALLVVSAAAAGTAEWLDQQKSSRRVAARLNIENGIVRAVEFGQEEKWQDAKRVLLDVQYQLAQAESDDLSRRIDRAQSDIEFAELLEHIRQDLASARMILPKDPLPDYRMLAKRYAQAFAQTSIDIEDAESAAARIRLSDLRVHIVTAIELWAFSEFSENCDSLQTKKLLRIAELADQGTAWHKRFRDPNVWQDPRKRVELAGEAANLTASLAAHQLAITGMLLPKDKAKEFNVPLLRSAVNHRARDYWLNWELGVALYSNGSYQQAVRYFGIVAALRPENTFTLGWLATSLGSAGELDEAIEVGRRAVELKPKHTVLRHNLAVDYFFKGEYRKAQNECLTILESDPKNASEYFLLGHICLGLKQREDAITNFRRATEIDPILCEAWHQLGVELANDNRLEDASVAFHKSVQVDPEFFLGHVGRGSVWLRQAKYKEAITEYKWVIQALERDKAAIAVKYRLDAKTIQGIDNDVRHCLADSLLSLGRDCISRKQWSQAADLYAQRIAQLPTTNYGEIWFEYAAVQLLCGDRNGYRQSCKRMLELAPKVSEMRSYHAARACTLAPDSADDPSLPLRVSAKELEFYTKEFWSLTEQGALCYRANRYKEATRCLEQSLQADSRQGPKVTNWLWLAMSSQKMGDKDQARNWLNKAINLLDLLGNEMPANAATTQGWHTHNWLEVQILRCEAETQVGTAQKK